MNKSNKTKIFLIASLVTLSVVVISLAGLLVYNLDRDAKVSESRSELTNIPDRIVPPTKVMEVEADKDEDIKEESSNDTTPEATPEVLETSEPKPQSTPTNNTPAPQPAKQEPAPAPAPQPPASKVTLQSSFKSVRNYKTSGSVSITQTGDKATVDFGSNFSFSGAPDPVVYLCKDKVPTSISNCLVLGALQSNVGAQSWSVTAAEASEYPNPVLWCRAFSLLMGHI